MRPWLASACWQLLIALQLQKDAVVIYKSLAERATLDLRVFTRVASTIRCRTLEDLGNTSEVQADERIIPDITDLDVPLVMGSRLREPIKAIQTAAKVSWDREREGAVEDEDVPRAAEELKRLGILERQHTHQSAAEGSMQKRIKHRLWLASKRQRKATEPTTVSRN